MLRRTSVPFWLRIRRLAFFYRLEDRNIRVLCLYVKLILHYCIGPERSLDHITPSQHDVEPWHVSPFHDVFCRRIQQTHNTSRKTKNGTSPPTYCNKGPTQARTGQKTADPPLLCAPFSRIRLHHAHRRHHTHPDDSPEGGAEATQEELQHHKQQL